MSVIDVCVCAATSFYGRSQCPYWDENNGGSVGDEDCEETTLAAICEKRVPSTVDAFTCAYVYLHACTCSVLVNQSSNALGAGLRL